MVYVDFSFYITTIYSTGCVKNMIPIQRSISQNLDKILTTLKLSLKLDYITILIIKTQAWKLYTCHGNIWKDFEKNLQNFLQISKITESNKI